jgi:hypothetical protein
MRRGNGARRSLVGQIFQIEGKKLIGWDTAHAPRRADQRIGDDI